MLPPHILFSGVVVPKYCFFHSSFQCRQHKHLAMTLVTMIMPTCEGSRSHLSGCFHCCCSWSGSNWGTEGQGPGSVPKMLEAQLPIVHEGFVGLSL